MKHYSGNTRTGRTVVVTALVVALILGATVAAFAATGDTVSGCSKKVLAEGLKNMADDTRKVESDLDVYSECDGLDKADQKAASERALDKVLGTVFSGLSDNENDTNSSFDSDATDPVTEKSVLKFELLDWKTALTGPALGGEDDAQVEYWETVPEGYSLIKVKWSAYNPAQQAIEGAPYPTLFYGPNRTQAEQETGYGEGDGLHSDDAFTQVGPGETVTQFQSFQVPTDQVESAVLVLSTAGDTDSDDLRLGDLPNATK